MSDVPVPAGDPRFHALLAELGRLHSKKSGDYGTGGDALANLRASAVFGISAFAGTMVRLNDKITRIASFLKNGFVYNESVFDSLLDIASYALLAHIILSEEQTDGKAVQDVRRDEAT